MRRLELRAGNLSERTPSTQLTMKKV